jgi:hypothetical protein
LKSAARIEGISAAIMDALVSYTWPGNLHAWRMRRYAGLLDTSSPNGICDTGADAGPFIGAIYAEG